MKLSEYVKENCVNLNAFAKRCGISRATIEHILLGKCVTLDTAYKIVVTSKGVIGYEDLLSKKILEKEKLKEEKNIQKSPAENQPLSSEI